MSLVWCASDHNIRNVTTPAEYKAIMGVMPPDGMFPDSPTDNPDKDVRPVWNARNRPDAYGKTPGVNWAEIPLATMAQNGLFDMEKWLVVEDTLRLVESAGGMLCGGWFGELAAGRMPKDYDFYFKDGKSFKRGVEMVARLSGQKLPDLSLDADLDAMARRTIFSSMNPPPPVQPANTAKIGSSKTYNKTNGTTPVVEPPETPDPHAGTVYAKGNMFIEFVLDGLKIQLIKSFFEPTIEGHLNKFDLTICQFGLRGDCVVTTVQALTDLKDRKLRLHARHDLPEATIKRLFKYQARGYNLAETWGVYAVDKMVDGQKIHTEAKLGTPLDELMYAVAQRARQAEAAKHGAAQPEATVEAPPTYKNEGVYTYTADVDPAKLSVTSLQKTLEDLKKSLNAGGYSVPPDALVPQPHVIQNDIYIGPDGNIDIQRSIGPLPKDLP